MAHRSVDAPDPKAAHVTVVWDPRFLDYDFGPSHPFQMRSRGLAARLVELVTAGEIPAPLSWVRRVDPATTTELARFHTPGYLRTVEALSAEDGGPPLDSGDTPSFPGCYDSAARIAAGTVHAIDAVRSRAHSIAVNPSGGLHHAHPGRASGFCIFNDLAVAIRRALDGPEPVDRVAYLDIDAHHGDGVMYGFYDDGRVLDIDVHQDGRTIFPGTGSESETGRGDGAGLKVNLPLPPGAGDEALVAVFDRIVPPLLRSFRPQLIVLQHGLDGHVGDRLARLQYTPNGYRHIVGTVAALSREVCEGRMVMTGGGGYRAESVALGLARSTLELAGDERAEAGPLPAPWQHEFGRVTGEPPPVGWHPVYRTAPSPWNDERTDRLAERIGRSLGVQFPRSA